MAYSGYRSLPYQAGQTAVYKVSRSKIELFMQCPRCFWLDARLKIGRPSSPPFNINKTIDELYKKEFDVHRAAGTWDREVDLYIALTEFSRTKFIEAGLPASKIFVKPNFTYPDPGAGSGQGGYALFVGVNIAMTRCKSASVSTPTVSCGVSAT